MNIIRKYKLTEEEKNALLIVDDILNTIRHKDSEYFEDNVLCNCAFEGFYRDYERIYRELTGGEN